MKRIVVGVLAHVDSGKTTLCEALLYHAGAIRELGRVDKKSSFFDHYAAERQRGITIFSKQATLTHRDTEIILLDTPGHVDFSAEAERTLQVLDYAILVISASDGVQSHTLTLWRLLQKYSVPTFLFINKMDLPDVDRDRLMRELSRRLSDGCFDRNAPQESLYETLALCDEQLLEAYTETGTLDPDEIARAIEARRIFPCCFGSALRDSGVEELLEVIDADTRQPAYQEDFAARVYKITTDQQGNRLTHLKITGGSLRVRETVESEKNRDGEKVTAIRVYSGEKYTAADEAQAGRIVAVTGLSFTRPGDALGAESGSTLPVLQPVMTYSMILPPDTDIHTAMQKMRILEAEDPLLHLSYHEKSGEIRLGLMGDVQLEILKAQIAERFGMDVEFTQGSIIYKETILDTVEGVGHFEPLRHYAEVHLILRPLPRDSGLRFRTACREDDLDKNWQRLILTHLYEKEHIGVLTGSPITDIEITLASGRAHAKHTEGGDFRQATYRAVRQGLRSAKSALLEPVYDFSLELPTENLGRAMADITRMNGSFEPPTSDGETSVLIGAAPVAAMRDYAREVVQYTRGSGRLSCSLKGYDLCHNADEVIAQIGYDPDSDTDNPCDSVFCSHGAGHNVRWDEVRSHMHLPSALNDRRTAVQEEPKQYFSRCRRQEDIFASDKELMRIFEQTYGPIKKRVQTAEERYYRAPAKPEKPKNKPYKPLYTGPEYVLVDGYNVVYAWEKLRALCEDNIDAARGALINILCNYQGYKKCELILVFDAYRVKGHDREVEQLDNISIVYTKEAETADTYIEKTAHQLSKDHRVRVVTSDLMEQLIIIGDGAIRVSSEEFYDEVKAAEDEIRAIIAGT